MARFLGFIQNSYVCIGRFGSLVVLVHKKRALIFALGALELELGFLSTISCWSSYCFVDTRDSNGSGKDVFNC